jgi:hypothetical protein
MGRLWLLLTGLLMLGPTSLLLSGRVLGRSMRRHRQEFTASNSHRWPALYGGMPFDIQVGQALAETKANISLLELIDTAPRLRTEVLKSITPKHHGNRKGPVVASVIVFDV